MTMGGLRPSELRQEIRSIVLAELKRFSADGLKGHALPAGIFPSCGLRQTVAQSIGNAYTKVTMDVTDWDNSAPTVMADLAGDQITIRYPGLYLILAYLAWAANPGTGSLAINAAGTRHPIASASDNFLARIRPLVIGDQVYMDGINTAGASNTSVVANAQGIIQAVWVGVPTT